jgi:hypothetical protein
MRVPFGVLVHVATCEVLSDESCEIGQISDHDVSCALYAAGAEPRGRPALAHGNVVGVGCTHSAPRAARENFTLSTTNACLTKRHHDRACEGNGPSDSLSEYGQQLLGWEDCAVFPWPECHITLRPRDALSDLLSRSPPLSIDHALVFE